MARKACPWAMFHVRGAHALGEILSRWRVNSPCIAQKREDPWLVENAPVGDAVAQGAGDDFRVLREAAGKIPIRPASRVFQFLRQVPMVKRAERPDFRFEQLIR